MGDPLKKVLPGQELAIPADGNEWGPDPFDTLDAGWVAKWPEYDTFSASGGRLINSAVANPNSGTWSALQRTASINPLGLKIIIESQVYSNPYSATTGIILTDGLSFRLFARWNLGGIGLYAFGTYYTFPNIAVQSGDKLSLKLCHTSGYQYKACYFRNETLVFEATGSYAFTGTQTESSDDTWSYSLTFTEDKALGTSPSAWRYTDVSGEGTGSFFADWSVDGSGEYQFSVKQGLGTLIGTKNYRESLTEENLYEIDFHITSTGCLAWDLEGGGVQTHWKYFDYQGDTGTTAYGGGNGTIRLGMLSGGLGEGCGCTALYGFETGIPLGETENTSATGTVGRLPSGGLIAPEAMPAAYDFHSYFQEFREVPESPNAARAAGVSSYREPNAIHGNGSPQLPQNAIFSDWEHWRDHARLNDDLEGAIDALANLIAPPATGVRPDVTQMPGVVVLDLYDVDESGDQSVTISVGSYFQEAATGYELRAPSGEGALVNASLSGGSLTISVPEDSTDDGLTAVTVVGGNADGLPVSWTVLVHVVAVEGYTVEEQAWGETTWDAPEDSGTDWALLWQCNDYRWLPQTTFDGLLTAANWSSTASFASVVVDSSRERWAYGTPQNTGEFEVSPTVTFGGETLYFETLNTASVGLNRGDAASAAQPRIAATYIESMEWEQVAYSREVEIEDYGTSTGMAKLTYGEDGYLVYPHERHHPEIQQPLDHTTVRVKAELGAAVPEGMVGTLHLAWYDPDNTLANVPTTSPTNDGYGPRDNVASLVEAGSGLPGFTLEFTTLSPSETSDSIQKAYLAVEDSRYGDNFVVAAHPHDGIVETYEFRENDLQEVGLMYQENTGLWKELPDDSSGDFQTSILTIMPLVDIDVDSDNTATGCSHGIERSDWEELIENEAGYPGKYVAFNNDDDNQNSIADYLENADYEYPPGLSWVPFTDDDLVLVVLDRGFEDLSGMDGFVFELKVTVGSERGLSYWLDQQKTPIIGSAHNPNYTAEFWEAGKLKRIYQWSVLNEAVNYPPVIYVEGVNPEALTDTLIWRLFKPTNVLIAEDTVKITDPSFNVDLDVDSNNDDDIDENDDPAADLNFEEKDPGKVLAVGINQRKPAKLKVNFPATVDPDGFTYTLVYDETTIEIFKSGQSGQGQPPTTDKIPSNTDVTTVPGITVAALVAGLAVYMDGVNLGATDIVFKATKDSLEVSDKVHVTVALDLDTDSNNNNDVEKTNRAEDNIEDWKGVDPNELGKRIFINKDDDNRNGLPDIGEKFTPDLNDQDLALILPQFEHVDLAKLAGFKLVLEAGKDLELFVHRNKQKLVPGGDPGDSATRPYTIPRPSSSSTANIYTWTISDSLKLPKEILAEGINLGDPKVHWRIVNTTGGKVVARDTVQLNVEKIVWPNQDPAALAALDVSKETTEWKGFELNIKTEDPADRGDNQGWFVDKTLTDMIIKGRAAGTDFGYIRTEYPKDTDADRNTERWEGSTEHNDSAVFDLGTLYASGDWPLDSTVVLTIEYGFEQSPNITTGQYVDTNLASYKPGFFHNSGVKIENQAEIQIYDTATLRGAINSNHAATIDGNATAAEVVSAVPGHSIDATGDVYLRHGSPATNWTTEKVNTLINGAPYAHPSVPNTMASLNAALTAGQITIEITKTATDKYQIVVNGNQYTDVFRASGDGFRDDALILQSHWGSGVRFNTAQVKKK